MATNNYYNYSIVHRVFDEDYGSGAKVMLNYQVSWLNQLWTDILTTHVFGHKYYIHIVWILNLYENSYSFDYWKTEFLKNGFNTILNNLNQILKFQ